MYGKRALSGGERSRMRLSVLASGSKGNAIFIEMDGTRLLLDVGIGLRRLKEGMTALGVPLDTLDGVLLTHEHRDHVVGLSALLKEVSLPVYSRPGTIAALPRRDLLPLTCLHPFRGDVVIGGVKVEPFPLSHDAAEPVGYRVRGSRTCTVATDLGFVTGAVQDAIEGADVLVLEANHDPATLKRGGYPWPLKQRILSNRGHLSNLDAAWALARMKKRPAQVFLAHLSEQNNRPELAEETVRDVLFRQGMPLSGTAIDLAKQRETVSFGESG